MPKVGYYPGDRPLPRGYDGGPIIQPAKYDLTALEYLYKDIAANLERPTDIPGGIWEQIKKDALNELRATAMPGGKYSPDVAEAKYLSQEEQDELPGAFGINTGSVPDWIKDPSKTAVKVVTSWWNSVADWDELERIAMVEMYRHAIKDPSPVSLGPLFGEATINPQDVLPSFSTPVIPGVTVPPPVVGKRKIKTLRYKGVGPNNEPLFEVYDESKGDIRVVDDVDAYGVVADKVCAFVLKADAASTRAAAYRDFNKAALDALKADVRGQLLAITNVPDSDDQHALALTLLGQAGNIYNLNPADPRYACGQMGDFILRVEVANGMSDVSDAMGIYGLTGVLEECIRTGNFSKIAKSLEKLDKIAKAEQDFLGDARLAYIGLADVVKLQDFTESTKAYQSLLTDIRQAVQDVTPVWSGGKFTDIESARFFGARIASLNARFTSNDNLLANIKKGNLLDQQGDLDDYLLGLVENFILKGDESELGAVLSQIPDTQERWRRLRIWAETVKRMDTQERNKDFVEVLADGGYLKTVLWVQRLKVRLKYYTPAYYISEFLRHVHYFGLAYDSDYAGKDLVIVLFGIKGLTLNFGKVGDAIMSNKIFDHYFSFNFNGVSALTQGGDHFKAAFNMGGIISNNAPITPTSFQMRHFMQLWRGEPLDAGVLVPKDIGETITKFRIWMQTHGSKWGLDAEHITEDQMRNLIMAIFGREGNKRLISALSSKAGLLNRLAQLLNQVQGKVSIVLGAIIRPIQYVKMLVARAVSGVLITSTGGAAAILKPVIEVIVMKLEDFAEDFIKAIFTGDLSGLYKEIEKTVFGVVKFIIVLVMIPFFFVILIMGTFLSVIPSADFSRGAIAPGTGGSGPSGPIPPLLVGGCPIQGSSLTVPSFRNTIAPTYGIGGHGSNAYWLATGNACSYGIPSGFIYVVPGVGSAPRSPGDSNSVCRNQLPSSPYYGYAADFISADRDQDGVYVPELEGISEWQVQAVGGFNVGNAVLLWGGSTDGHEIRLLIGHLEPTLVTVGQMVKHGDSLGRMAKWPGASSPGFNRHIHLEMTYDGTPVKPEDYFCK